MSQLLPKSIFYLPKSTNKVFLLLLAKRFPKQFWLYASLLLGINHQIECNLYRMVFKVDLWLEQDIILK